MNAKTLDAFAQALKRLEEALAMPSSGVVRDACIQRFEFSFELAWKAIQHTARIQGRECVSPRSCLREAFAMSWLTDETAWLEMLADRNLTSHTYDEALAQAIYERLARHVVRLKDLEHRLSNLD